MSSASSRMSISSMLNPLPEDTRPVTSSSTTSIGSHVPLLPSSAGMQTITAAAAREPWSSRGKQIVATPSIKLHMSRPQSSSSAKSSSPSINLGALMKKAASTPSSTSKKTAVTPRTPDSTPQKAATATPKKTVAAPQKAATPNKTAATPKSTPNRIKIGSAAANDPNRVRPVIKYKVHTPATAEQAQQMARFQMETKEEILEANTFVPYKSEKKKHFDGTGVKGIDAFYYSFCYDLPEQGEPEKDVFDNDKPLTIVWDYNLGLVRMAGMFRALGFAKTIPKRAIDKSPGLAALCPSVTGGSIAAQGYYVPYEAARAMATTFAWRIRFALVPLFGPSFPGECIRPGDEGFARFAVDPAIVRQCAARLPMFDWADGAAGEDDKADDQDEEITSAAAALMAMASSAPPTPTPSRPTRSAKRSARDARLDDDDNEQQGRPAFAPKRIRLVDSRGAAPAFVVAPARAAAPTSVAAPARASTSAPARKKATPRSKTVQKPRVAPSTAALPSASPSLLEQGEFITEEQWRETTRGIAEGKFPKAMLYESIAELFGQAGFGSLADWVSPADLGIEAPQGGKVDGEGDTEMEDVAGSSAGYSSSSYGSDFE